MIGKEFRVKTYKYGFVCGEIVTIVSNKFKRNKEYWVTVKTSALQTKDVPKKYLRRI